MNWGNNNININRNIGNVNVGNRVGGGNWTHNAAHRGGVRYNNSNVAQKFGGNRGGAQNRMDFRGKGGQQVLQPGGNRGNLGAERAGEPVSAIAVAVRRPWRRQPGPGRRSRRQPRWCRRPWRGVAIAWPTGRRRQCIRQYGFRPGGKLPVESGSRQHGRRRRRFPRRRAGVEVLAAAVAEAAAVVAAAVDAVLISISSTTLCCLAISITASASTVSSITAATPPMSG